MKTLPEALRCSAATEHIRCDGPECPYFTRASEEDIKSFCEETGSKREQFKDDFWDGCDLDRISLDAADLIEKLWKNS